MGSLIGDRERAEEVRTSRASYTVGVGVDLGRKSDHTAVAVAEMRYLLEPRPDGSSTLCVVRQWERYELGLEWPNIASRIARTVEAVLDLLWSEWQAESDRLALQSVNALYMDPDDDTPPGSPPFPRIKLNIDSTGVGDPVVGMITANLGAQGRYQNSVTATPCFFTHGDRLTRNKGQWSVGKGWLVGRLTLLIQLGLLRVSPGIYHADEAIEELLEYEGRIDERANEKYGAFSVGSHDDLVTALGLAVLDLRADWRSRSLHSGVYG